MKKPSHPSKTGNFFMKKWVFRYLLDELGGVRCISRLPHLPPFRIRFIPAKEVR